jgi:hypothetical protein
MEKKIIGRKDILDLPDLKLLEIPVKIDSGAYSCSIHVNFIEEVEKDGKKMLNVIFLDQSMPQYSGEIVNFSEFSKKIVKSSTGEKQERYFVKTTITLFNTPFLADFSLSQRNGLKNPVLIGRKLLNKHFLIDTARTNLSFKEKNI